MIHNLTLEDFSIISDSITVMKKSSELLNTYENNLVLKMVSKKLNEQAEALTKTIGMMPTACRDELFDGKGVNSKEKQKTQENA